MTATIETGGNIESYIKELLSDARKERIKGRYYIYEHYKLRLQMICDKFNTCEPYESTIIELAKILKV